MIIRLPGWRLAVVGLGVIVVVGLAGCSSGTSATPSATPFASATPPASTATVCTDADALRSSLQQLAHVNVISQGTNGVKTAVQDVETHLTTLVTDAQGQWKPQTDALTSAITTLRSTVSGLGSQPNPASAATAVAGALSSVESAASNLFGAVVTTCPSQSPSPASS